MGRRRCVPQPPWVSTHKMKQTLVRMVKIAARNASAACAIPAVVQHLKHEVPGFG